MSKSPTFPLEEVLHERVRQDVKWGEQNHAPLHWLAILAEEFGEASKAVVEATAAYVHDVDSNDEVDYWLAELRAELIQTAAVAVAFVESLDRNELA